MEKNVCAFIGEGCLGSFHGIDSRCRPTSGGRLASNYNLVTAESTTTVAIETFWKFFAFIHLVDSYSEQTHPPGHCAGSNWLYSKQKMARAAKVLNKLQNGRKLVYQRESPLALKKIGKFFEILKLRWKIQFKCTFKLAPASISWWSDGSFNFEESSFQREKASCNETLYNSFDLPPERV